MAAGLQQHPLHTMLDEGEYYATVIRVQRAGYNLDTYGAVAGANSAGYLIQYENAPDVTTTVYEGDHLSAWIAIYNEDSGEIRGFGLGDDEAGHLRISGFDADDVDRGVRAAYNFWTDVENVGGVWTAEFADNFRNNGASRQGIQIETGAESRYTNDHGFIHGNGSTIETVQTISIDGLLENPWYDWSTGEDGDLLSGLTFGLDLTYVDYADALLVDDADGDADGDGDEDGDGGLGEGETSGGSDDGTSSGGGDAAAVEFHYGARGADRIAGDAGNDWIWGYGGRDVLKGFGGDDELRGGAGRDTLIGGGGDDLIAGDGGKDTLKGGRGNDVLEGGRGDDKLVGGGGDDLLYGAGRRDMLIGGRGDDLLDPGAGRDVLKGGAGADWFWFFNDYGRNTIKDWEDGVDLIQITSYNASGLEDLEIRDVRAGAAIRWEGTTVILAGRSAAEIGVDDFDFG